MLFGCWVVVLLRYCVAGFLCCWYVMLLGCGAFGCYVRGVEYAVVYLVVIL